MSRAGRFSEKIHFDIPSSSNLRKEILKCHIKKYNLSDKVDTDDLDKVVEKTEGFSGAGLQDFLRAANASAIRKGSEKIIINDFIKAIEKIQSDRSLFKKEFGTFLDIHKNFIQSFQPQLC